jgi:ABC-2 type transport system ATP-binding protein
MKSNIIHVENVIRKFGDNTAVNDLSFEVREGEIFGFLGHNGAGKTTTVRMLNGVLKANSGSIRVMELDPVADGPTLRAHTGVLTETAALELRLTARENLIIYANIFGVPRKKVSSRVDELLDFFGISEFADQRVETFSTGMRQRLALARTLLHDPDIIYLDEPTSGLDPIAAHQVHELIANLAEEKGRTVFLCTHNLVEAQKLCDRVGVMEHGKLVAIGTPQELIQQYVHHLDVDIETAPEQKEIALKMLSDMPSLVRGVPHKENGNLTMTVSGRESIPALLELLVMNKIHVYQINAHQPTLEDVYFTINGEQEAIE